MNGPQFLYDTHYQLDKPLALLDVTLATASPTVHASSDALAVRLVKRAASRPVSVGGKCAPWRIDNVEAMKYWISNCHDTELLSRQNAYDYWLMNFEWIGAFDHRSESWGNVAVNERRVRLLLWRWAWLCDGVMLACLCWTMARNHARDPGALVEGRHVEEMVGTAFGGLLELSSSPRERAEYRKKVERMRSQGFKYNTRRHKLLTHWGILADAGLLNADGTLNSAVSRVVDRYDTMKQVAAAALRRSAVGFGGELFWEITSAAFGVPVPSVTELRDADWEALRPTLMVYWKKVEAWDRKFLGIRALAELELTTNVLDGRPVWPSAAWQEYLVHRARVSAEELTVHVNRFGSVEYLRFA